MRGGSGNRTTFKIGFFFDCSKSFLTVSYFLETFYLRYSRVAEWTFDNLFLIFIFKFPPFYDAENDTTWKLIVFSWTDLFFDGYSDSGYWSGLCRIFTFHIRIIIAMLKMVKFIHEVIYSDTLEHEE